MEFSRLGTVGFYWRAAVRPYPRQAAAIFFFLVAGALLDAAIIGLTVPVLDVLTAPEHSAHSPLIRLMDGWLRGFGWSPTTNLLTFTLITAASVLFLLHGAFQLLTQYETAAIAVRLRRTMKAALFDKFLCARYEDMAARSRGTVVNDINQPADALAGAITQLAYFLTGIFNSLLMIALLLYLSWWATLVIGVIAVSAVQGWRLYADRRSAVHGRTLYDLRGEQNKLQVDAVDGLKVVKAHGLEPQMVERQDRLLAGEYRPELQLVVFRHGPTLLNEIVAILIVVGLGAATFLAPSLGLRFSMLAAFLLAIRRIAPALSSINSASVNLNRYKRNLEVIEEVLKELPQERRGGEPAGRIEEIRIEEVSFRYAARPEQEVLSGVSVMLRRGAVTAVVGPTGSGKSTIAQLLLGLYEPVSGSIRINGRELSRADLAAWRRRIGYVSQDVFVFNTTIRDNIALGDETLPEEQIVSAAKLAQLHEFIVSLPQGYGTVVGDRGLRLSGGQCQRLAIARAILRHPEVLILDEATSALDTLTERAVYEAIRTLQAEAVVLVIAHRLSTVKEADQILVLDQGRIVEAGTHEALVGKQGPYSRLYEEQPVSV